MKSDQIVIPSSLQTAVIKYAHEGHLGINLCKRLLRNRCWFPSIDSMVEAEVKDCLACQANTDTTHFNPIIPTSLPAHKWAQVAIDFSSKTPTGEYILVAICENTRYPILTLARNLTSKQAIACSLKFSTNLVYQSP